MKINYFRIILFVFFLGVLYASNRPLAMKSFDIEDVNNKDLEKSLVENLKKLSELYKSGVLTEEEFTKAKNKILNK